MRKSIYSYDTAKLREELRKEAIEMCRKFAPYAISIEIIDALRRVKVFVKCVEV